MQSETIGLKIKELRTSHGLTQKQLGASLGISQDAISRYEKGERDVDVYTLCGIADYFHVTVDYILDRTSVTSPDTDIQAICSHTGLTQKAVEVLCGQLDIEDSVIQEAAIETGAEQDDLKLAIEKRNTLNWKRRGRVLSLLLEHDTNNQLFDRLLDYFDSEHIKFANNTYDIERVRDGELDFNEYLSHEPNFGGSVVIRNKRQKSLAYVGSSTFIDAVLLHAVENEINSIRKKYHDANTLPWLK